MQNLYILKLNLGWEGLQHGSPPPWGCMPSVRKMPYLLLYLYRARNKITQLSIPTHAQLQRHRLKFIKNHLKKLLHVSVFNHLQGVTISSLRSLL